MQPPSPIPSKNWWNDKATNKGLIVSGVSEVPKDNPIMTE